MKILALDSSSLVASVAIITEDILTAEYTINYKKTHSQTLLPMLDEITKLIELDLNTIDAIAVSAGPGSFTGLRIGSATAKGLGLALKKPLISVSTLEAMAYNLYAFPDSIVPIMDARRNQVYTGIYTFEGEKIKIIKDACAIEIDKLLEELNQSEKQVIFVGDGIPVFENKIRESLTIPYQFAPAHLNRQRAASVGALASIYYQEGKTETAMEHKPNYLRISQAERELAEKMQAKKKIQIRDMQKEDLEQVYEIEKQSSAMLWSKESLTKALEEKDCYYIVAEEEKEIIGYLSFQKILEQADIHNIAVELQKRGQGIGNLLLNHAIKKAKEIGITQITLEVRESNQTAIHLYEKNGFIKEGKRPNYYEKPKEDAWIMWKRNL